MTFKVTNDWDSGDTLTHTDLNQNFTDVETALNGGLTTSHISAAAAIKSSQIADRYHMVKTVIPLIPFSAVGTATMAGAAVTAAEMATEHTEVYSQTVEFSAPASETTLYKHEIIANSGHEGFLYAIHIYAIATSSNSTNDVQLGFYLNDALIGQLVDLDTDDAHYRLHATDPFTNPLVSLTTGDVIKITIQSESGATSARGVTATLFEKWPISS